MNMDEGHIAVAISNLRIAEAEFAKLTVDSVATFTTQIEDKFVEGHGWTRWWEHFVTTDCTAVETDGAGCSWIDQLIPNGRDRVWFILSPDSRQRFPVYNVIAKHIQPVLEDCPYLEYYIVSQALDWLICENHHGIFCFIGDIVADKIRQVGRNYPDKWRVHERG